MGDNVKRKSARSARRYSPFPHVLLPKWILRGSFCDFLNIAGSFLNEVVTNATGQVERLRWKRKKRKIISL